MKRRTIFPFSALVGQEPLKTALLVNTVDPLVGGVLVRGHKGAGKSTAARALAGLLPALDVIEGCPCHCDPRLPRSIHAECDRKITSGAALSTTSIPTPMIELPLSATEDRIVGALDIESALKRGERRFDPGLLASANRGILYVDEVNLLPDHLVDLLLDAAASGINIVERDGIRLSHPARFMLIGTMNPEEGELRPQFLDRFGLCIHIATIADPGQRAEIVRRRIAFEQDPESFADDYAEEEASISRQVRSARERLDTVTIDDEHLQSAARIAVEAEVQGHRPEIAMIRTARAMAALLDKTAVGNEDLLEAARLVLPHRIALNPLEKPQDTAGKIEDLLAAVFGLDAARRPKPADIDDLELMDNHDFPGAAAAGSMLFTYLKKKIPKTPPNRTTASF